MDSKEKLSELIKNVNELTAQEREQFTSELLLMMVNQPDSELYNQQKTKNSSSASNPEADSKELAFLLKRLNHHHNDYIHRII